MSSVVVLAQALSVWLLDKWSLLKAARTPRRRVQQLPILESDDLIKFLLIYMKVNADNEKFHLNTGVVLSRT